MRSRRRDDDFAVVLRLFSIAFVHIRFAAYEGDLETARRLADAFHNAPSHLIVGSPDAVLADLREQCEQHGHGALFAELLAQAGHG